MNIVVAAKLVPDLVEELTIADDGSALDMASMRMILSEFDDQAIEEAILLKERSGAQVTVVALDMDGVDDTLYMAAAKGADRLVKVTGDWDLGANNHALARVFAAQILDLRPDLVLTGVQAHNDLDGPVGPLLAHYLGMPYIGYVAGVTLEQGRACVRKEYPGGLVAEMEITLPATLGIQVAEQPPRYVAFSRIRQAMKSAILEEKEAGGLDPAGGPAVNRMFQPEAAQRATLITGDKFQVAARLADLFREHGVL